MKTMTCKQLGGSCDITFHAETFEEIAQMSHAHGREMVETQDPRHLAAMEEMKTLMKNPEAMNTWMKEKRQIFESLPQE